MGTEHQPLERRGKNDERWSSVKVCDAAQRAISTLQNKQPATTTTRFFLNRINEKRYKSHE